jgi:aspartyl-tRNA(Asn)/glutamyl-tRNA(Gln) amidotransferase subunit B
MAAYDNNPKALANYIANELQRERSQAEGDGMLPMEQVKLKPEALAALVRLIDEGTLTKHLARDVLIEMFASGKSADAIIAEKGIQVVATDSGELEQWCRDAVAGNPVAAQQVRDGNDKAVNSFMGPIMKASKGKANPQAVRDMLLKLIAGG